MILQDGQAGRNTAKGNEQRTSEPAEGNGQSLRHSVSVAVKTYLEQLDGQMGSEVYQMVLAEVEAPLLEEIMRYTRNNQTKASRMLGLNRGTLRKKLKMYGLLEENSR
jgi:Fis family transcriptional regulator